MAATKILDLNGMTYDFENYDEEDVSTVSVGIYGVQIAPDGTAFLLCGDFYADTAVYSTFFIGKLYKSSVDQWVDGAEQGDVLGTELQFYNDVTSDMDYMAVTWATTFDYSQNVLWVSAGNKLQRWSTAGVREYESKPRGAVDLGSAAANSAIMTRVAEIGAGGSIPWPGSPRAAAGDADLSPREAGSGESGTGCSAGFAVPMLLGLSLFASKRGKR